jgi:hypothetical protein
MKIRVYNDLNNKFAGDLLYLIKDHQFLEHSPLVKIRPFFGGFKLYDRTIQRTHFFNLSAFGYEKYAGKTLRTPKSSARLLRLPISWYLKIAEFRIMEVMGNKDE